MSNANIETLLSTTSDIVSTRRDSLRSRSSAGKVVRYGTGHARMYNRSYSEQHIDQGEQHPLNVPDHHSDLEGQSEDTGPPGLFTQIKNVFLGSYLNVLLICVPFAFISNYVDWPGWLTFLFSFFSLIPLAAMLGQFTEDLALRTSESLGALLNATFGNATELIISIFALKDCKLDVIKNSLLGSVLGNLILVLGCAIVAAGYKRKEVRFNAHAMNVYSTLLFIASAGLLIPTVFHMAHGKGGSSGDNDVNALEMSRSIAICMLMGYVMFVLFQLKTHKQLFADVGTLELDEEDEAEEEVCAYYLTTALVGLAVSTVLIAFASEFLVGAIEAAAEDMKISRSFIGVILVPIVGNAAEHATAVVMAWKGKMDIAIGVAVGSSIQIATSVVPLLVIVGWWSERHLALVFDIFPLVVMMMGILTTTVICNTGKVHWLEGALLLLVYLMIALAYIFYGDQLNPSVVPANPCANVTPPPPPSYTVPMVAQPPTPKASLW